MVLEMQTTMETAPGMATVVTMGMEMTVMEMGITMATMVMEAAVLVEMCHYNSLEKFLSPTSMAMETPPILEGTHMVMAMLMGIRMVTRTETLMVARVAQRSGGAEGKAKATEGEAR